jgi:4-hydroxy-tetrahydrodipicolinate reductase
MGESIRLVVFGAAGRMGRAILECASQSADLAIVAGVVRRAADPATPAHVASCRFLQLTEVPPDLHADALIDVAGAGGFDSALEIASRRRWPLVSGSTGLSETQQAAIRHASSTIPVLQAANFSLGVAVLAHLVAQAAQLLPDWDCEIIEAHHRLKKDAPSGTALMLGQRAHEARGGMGRDRIGDASGPRDDHSIGYAVVRAGDIVGEHEVRLVAAGERIELVHRALDRAVFARGALSAARWLVGKSPGIYAMSDVLGIRQG